MSDHGNEGRIIHFDALRVLAVFAVMVLHIAASGWFDMDVRAFEWRMKNVYDSIARWGVPVFVMISGSLFLSRDISIKKLYRKYICRLAAAFLFWSFCYAFVFSFLGKQGVRSFLRSFISGYYHLWFLYMMIGLYMIAPFLKKIVENPKLINYFLILALAFAVLIPEIISVVKAFSAERGEWAESVVDQAHMKFVLGYPMYYILGYYLSKTEISKKTTVILCGLGILGFISTAVLSQWISIKLQQPVMIFYDNMTLNVMLEAIAVFVFFKNVIGKIKFSEKTGRILAKLSKYSFGAYLVHAAVIKGVGKYLGLNGLSFHPLLSVPMVAVLVFVLSFGISALLNHIPVIKKYFV